MIARYLRICTKPVIFSPILLSFSFALASQYVAADEFDVGLSNDSVQAVYSTNIEGRFMAGGGYGEVDVLYTEEDDFQLVLGLLVRDELTSSFPGLWAGIGFELVGASVEDEEVGALGIHAELRYLPPSLPRVVVGTEMTYAPKVVSFGDAERYFSSQIRLEYEVLPQAAVYIGYKKFEYEIESVDDITLDEGLNFGLRLTF